MEMLFCEGLHMQVIIVMDYNPKCFMEGITKDGENWQQFSNTFQL
jgi:hypothetical protein